MRRLTTCCESARGDAILSGPTPDDLRAKVFEDRETPGNWRVEKMDEDGGYDVVKVFTGPDAREQAIRYAERGLGIFDWMWHLILVWTSKSACEYDNGGTRLLPPAVCLI